jgi:hypothetical protein
MWHNLFLAKFGKLSIVATLTLGSWPRQGLVRGVGQEEARVCVKVWEWTLTLPSELPCWEFKSRWTSKSLKNNYRGQNPWDCEVLYIIEKLLKLGCLKCAFMTSFGHVKHKLCPKKRLGIKLTIWLPTTKSQESPWFPCVQVACNIPLESSSWGI